MSTTTVKKENLTILSFFDKEELDLFSKVIQKAIDEQLGDTVAIGQARGFISTLPFRNYGEDIELWAVINYSTSEGIFSAINAMWKEANGPEEQAALQDMAWKIQDYVY